ncbi:nucleolin, partial [Galemys pyrenaicus]
VEEDSEDEKTKMMIAMEKEVVIPQEKGKKVTLTLAKQRGVVATLAKKAMITQTKKSVTPAKAIAKPGKKGTTPGKKTSVATPGKTGAIGLAKEDGDEEEEEEEDEEDEFEPAVIQAAAALASKMTEETAMETVPVKGKKAPLKDVPMTSMSMVEDDDKDDEEDDSSLGCQSPELKTGLSDLFAKNDLAVVDVKISVSMKFSYMDFEFAKELEEALEFNGLKVFGNEIKSGKPVRKVEMQEHFWLKVSLT